MLPLLLTLIASQPATTAPADSFRYRIVAKSIQEIDASAMGQPSQTVEITTTALITLRLTDSAGGQVAHIVVDSAGVDAGEMAAMIDPAMLEVPAGAFFHFFVREGKALGNQMPSATSLPVLNLVGPIGMLFSNPSPSAKIGDIWSDTVKVDTVMAQGSSKMTTISKWKLAGEEAGGRVLDAESTGTLSVESPMGGMSGTTTGKQHLVTRARGPLIRLSSETISNMAMTSAQVTIKGTTRITVEPIP